MTWPGSHIVKCTDVMLSSLVLTETLLSLRLISRLAHEWNDQPTQCGSQRADEYQRREACDSYKPTAEDHAATAPRFKVDRGSANTVPAARTGHVSGRLR